MFELKNKKENLMQIIRLIMEGKMINTVHFQNKKKA